MEVRSEMTGRTESEAKSYFDSCLETLDTKTLQPNQKFQIGDKVKVAKDLGGSMSHFKNDYVGTVDYTYSQMFGGTDFSKYSITDENGRSSAWYHELQLEKINEQ